MFNYIIIYDYYINSISRAIRALEYGGKVCNIIIYRIMKFILKFIRGHTWSATEIQKNVMYKIESSLNTIRKTRYQP